MCTCGEDNNKNHHSNYTLADCKKDCAADKHCQGIEYWSGLGTTERNPTPLCNQCSDIKIHHDFTSRNHSGYPPTIYAKGISSVYSLESNCHILLDHNTIF